MGAVPKVQKEGSGFRFAVLGCFGLGSRAKGRVYPEKMRISFPLTRKARASRDVEHDEKLSERFRTSKP